MSRHSCVPSNTSKLYLDFPIIFYHPSIVTRYAIDCEPPSTTWRYPNRIAACGSRKDTNKLLSLSFSLSLSLSLSITYFLDTLKSSKSPKKDAPLHTCSWHADNKRERTRELVPVSSAEFAITARPPWPHGGHRTPGWRDERLTLSLVDA